MKLNFNYLENRIEMKAGEIRALEIENKSYFYRIISELAAINRGEIIEGIQLYDENDNEMNAENKFSILIDYFDFENYTKKYMSSICKNLGKEIDEIERNEILKIYTKLVKKTEKVVNKFDFSISLKADFDLEKLLKLLNATLVLKETLLENLMLLIDIEKVLNTKKVLVFVNLKEYLEKNEIKELYKYAIYNNINIMLIDSRAYGPCLEYEKKLIIDSNFDEFMI